MRRLRRSIDRRGLRRVVGIGHPEQGAAVGVDAPIDAFDLVGPRLSAQPQQFTVRSRRAHRSPAAVPVGVAAVAGLGHGVEYPTATGQGRTIGEAERWSVLTACALSGFTASRPKTREATRYFGVYSKWIVLVVLNCTSIDNRVNAPFSATRKRDCCVPSNWPPRS